MIIHRRIVKLDSRGSKYFKQLALTILTLLGLNCRAAVAGQQQLATPVISDRPSQNGALIVTVTSSNAAATIHYTIDGSEPTAKSPVFEAPFLVSTRLIVKSFATSTGSKDSAVATASFPLDIPAGTLVWSDEFTNLTGSVQQPDPVVWTYDTGGNGFGNHELETYCAWGTKSPPCDPSNPNSYVGTDNALHVVARKTAAGYTSARMKSQGLLSVQYGRIEARIRAPEAQGLWPAFWTLGNNIATVDWPACGEQDIMERVDAAVAPDWNAGSIHGTGFVGDVGLSTRYAFPAGQTAAQWHTYGIIWRNDSVAFYIDDPARPYAFYTNPESLSKFKGAVWPFDSGDSAFFLINLAVGGDWPGPPNAGTSFPSELLVDYVRIYKN